MEPPLPLDDARPSQEESQQRDGRFEVSRFRAEYSADFDFSVAALSDVGRSRRHNEDAWLVQPPIYVVADGMGGHEAGDIASQVVVRAFASLADKPLVTFEDIDACVQAACAQIGALAAGTRGAPGSTVVAAVMTEQDGVPFWLIANVGDSRAYFWYAGELEQISKDHSVVQELIDAGQINQREARRHPERHIITRAIGALEDSMAEFVLVPVVAGSRLLLCSDGLSSEVPDELIAGVLAATNDPQSAVRELVETAVSRGGRDNVTVVLVDAVGDDELDPDTLRGLSAVNGDTVRTRFA